MGAGAAEGGELGDCPGFDGGVRTFNAVAGLEYLIAVDSDDDEEAPFTLRLTDPTAKPPAPLGPSGGKKPKKFNLKKALRKCKKVKRKKARRACVKKAKKKAKKR